MPNQDELWGARCAFCGATVGLQMIQRETIAGGCYWVCQQHVSMVEGRAVANPNPSKSVQPFGSPAAAPPTAEAEGVLELEHALSGAVTILKQVVATREIRNAATGRRELSPPVSDETRFAADSWLAAHEPFQPPVASREDEGEGDG